MISNKVFLRYVSIFVYSAFLGIMAIAPFVAHAEDKNVFNVGVIIPLTGDLADYGSSIQRGFELAVSSTPQKFSNIHFVFEDSRYDANTAVSALNKLRTMNDADLYYAWGVSPTEAIIPITEANKLPLLVETTLKESTANKHYVIRAARTGERIAQALVDQISKRKIKSVSLIVADIPFYDDIVKHLNLLLPEKGIKITKVKNILPSDNQIRPYVLELKRQNAEAIGVFLLPSQIISFYKGAAELKLVRQTFSADIIGSESIINDCPGNINGTFFTEVGLTGDFRTLYSQKYGHDGHMGHAAQAFDVANLIRDLFGNLKRKLSSNDIITAISEIAPRSGATGQFRFSDTADGGKELRMPVAMKVIQGKKIETIVEDTKF